MGDSYFTQEDKQSKQILRKIVQPVRDQRDGNEGSLGIAIYTYSISRIHKHHHPVLARLDEVCVPTSLEAACKTLQNNLVKCNKSLKNIITFWPINLTSGNWS